MVELRVPDRLRQSTQSWWGEEGPAWLADLPGRVEELAGRWQLELLPPFEPGGSTSWSAPATRADGTDVVLKVVVPDRESRHEAAALRLYDGEAAVRLFDHDDEHHALLLEHCLPGTPLTDSASDEAVLVVGARLLARLWRPPPTDHPFESLIDVAGEWAGVAQERFDRFDQPFEPDLAARGIELLTQLPETASRQAVLHCDFHPGNVLSAQRQRWLVIDPKPMVGDPAFDVVQLLLQPGDLLAAGDADVVLDARIRTVTSILGLPRERVLNWCLARSVEWALWALDVGDDDNARWSIGAARLSASMAP